MSNYIIYKYPGLVTLINYKLVYVYLRIFFLCLGQQQSLADENPAIRFGVLSIAQPSRIFINWQPFADYMSKHLGQPVEIVVPRGFGKMKQDISNGKLIFFISIHMYSIA